MITIVRMLTVDEGVKYRVYLDSKGKRTVGIGFNMDDPNAKAVWQQANILESFDNVISNAVQLSIASVGDLFNTCVSNAKADLRELFPTFDSFPEGPQLALINMMFNMGAEKLKGFHDMLGAIHREDWDNAAKEARNSVWYGEVKGRGYRVVLLMLGDDSGYASTLSL